ncbi:MAG TPA: Gfo/Idh/MocA family oxidoreductase [Vicinamibacterales bacterium]|nr:Gfo/Idh/MocA family oxidoreductase [Vicinamibacterales bacterium]
MPGHEPIDRRRFLERTTGLAAAAWSLGAARPASGQINNAAGLALKPVRLGFIGIGIRGTLLMEAAQGIAGVEIAAAADCYKGHLDRARELISPAVETTGDYTRILARPDIDAVVIATPDHWHLRMTQEALAAGKHVYIEKPMTHSWEEGEAFIAAADASGKVLQVGSQYMSMGCAREAAALIRSGRLGQVTLVEGRIHRNTATGAWYYPIPPDASPATVDWKRFIGPAPARDFDLRRFFQWRLFWDYSGGLPTDLFVHLITATHQLMGVQEPESVMSFGDIFHWKEYREVPDQMTAMVRYPEGFVLQLTSTSNNGHPGPLLTFYGTEGTLEYSGTSFTYHYQPRSENFSYSTHSWPQATVAEFRKLMNLDDRLRPVDGPAAAGPVEYRSPNDEDSTRAHIRNWIDAARTGGKPIEDVRFGHHAALVGHMCNVSHRERRPVRWNKQTRRVEM